MVNSSIRCIIALLLLVAAFPAIGAPRIAQTAGSSIVSLAVNPTANRHYVAFDSSTAVIDGASNAVMATIPISGRIVVNPNSNRIYIGDKVIDGTTNAVLASLPVAARAVNPNTNRIYGIGPSGDVLVVDGATNTIVATIRFNVSPFVEITPVDVAVNSATNRVYVTTGGGGRSNSFFVFDGATNNRIAMLDLLQILLSPPAFLAVNPATDRIYAGGNVINGETNTVVANTPIVVYATNPTTNCLYGEVPGSSNMLGVVDGDSNAIVATIPLSFFPSIVTVNPATNRIYAAHGGGTSVTVIDGASNTVVAAISLPTPPLAPHDARYFSPTGFRIDNDVFWDYFNKRGGIRTFGYPVSRTFPFLGFTTQFFQREIMQLGPDGAARTLNILDPDLMPYTTINGAIFPGVDPAITSQAPAPGSPGYGTAVLGFVKAHAPDQFEGMNTNYYRTFANTVTLNEAFPGGGGDPNLLLGFDLEMWGVPTSNPARDPHNGNFIYLRFQRGVLHFDATNNVTQGLLLADYLKSILTGQNLPSDLDAQSKGSRFYKQYNPAKPQSVDRPNDLPATDLNNAFQTQ